MSMMASFWLATMTLCFMATNSFVIPSTGKPHQIMKISAVPEQAIGEEMLSTRRRRRSRDRAIQFSRKPTLYQILNSAPNATYAELRRNYLDLAKQFHPDAAIGKSIANGEEEFSAAKFSEISTAWKILSDPKQRLHYDRTIQADAFADNLVKIATEISKAAAPTLESLFENVALPFIEKATASTATRVRSAAQDISNTMMKKKNMRKKE